MHTPSPHRPVTLAATIGVHDGGRGDDLVLHSAAVSSPQVRILRILFMDVQPARFKSGRSRRRRLDLATKIAKTGSAAVDLAHRSAWIASPLAGFPTLLPYFPCTPHQSAAEVFRLQRADMPFAAGFVMTSPPRSPMSPSLSARTAPASASHGNKFFCLGAARMTSRCVTRLRGRTPGCPIIKAERVSAHALGLESINLECL